jgi:biopolymer transport protein ExbD
MKLAHTIRRRRAESVVPMINVVFLLLVFFLMTAQITAPEPFEVTPPSSAAQNPAQGGETLFVSAQGVLAYGPHRGQAVFAALGSREDPEPLQIRADHRVDGAVLAALLPKLAAAGISDVTLISVKR